MLQHQAGNCVCARARACTCVLWGALRGEGGCKRGAQSSRLRGPFYLICHGGRGALGKNHSRIPVPFGCCWGRIWGMERLTGGELGQPGAVAQQLCADRAAGALPAPLRRSLSVPPQNPLLCPWEGPRAPWNLTGPHSSTHTCSDTSSF